MITIPNMQPLNISLKGHFFRLSEHLPALPSGVEWLLPLSENPDTARVFGLFLDKYYGDDQRRTLLLGINPGRFGAGITNVAFTDPIHLERDCGIPNPFPKREELSALFVYRTIHGFGGPESFYRQFFINSVVPFGFVKGGKNYNYYDEKPLQEAIVPFVKMHLQGLLDLGVRRDACICLGEGKNFQFLSKLNEKEGFFEKIISLPHPRFIMQYRRKRMEEYVNKYLGAIEAV